MEPAIAGVARSRAQVLVMTPSIWLLPYHNRIIGIATALRLPTVFADASAVELGGLVTYGPNFSDAFRRAAIYVTRILKGALPSELPIDQMEKLEMVVNPKTARALGLKVPQSGLKVPQSVLLRADREID